MTPNEIAHLRADFLAFTEYMFQARKGVPMMRAKHQDLICTALEKVVVGKTKRLIIAQYKCESCGSNVQLQCHHITYERLTRERIDDLVILCGGSNGCHQRIHDILGYDRTTEYPISVLKDSICQ